MLHPLEGLQENIKSNIRVYAQLIDLRMSARSTLLGELSEPGGYE